MEGTHLLDFLKVVIDRRFSRANEQTLTDMTVSDREFLIQKSCRQLATRTPKDALVLLDHVPTGYGAHWLLLAESIANSYCKEYPKGKHPFSANDVIGLMVKLSEIGSNHMDGAQQFGRWLIQGHSPRSPINLLHECVSCGVGCALIERLDPAFAEHMLSVQGSRHDSGIPPAFYRDIFVKCDLPLTLQVRLERLNREDDGQEIFQIFKDLSAVQYLNESTIEIFINVVGEQRTLDMIGRCLDAGDGYATRPYIRDGQCQKVISDALLDVYRKDLKSRKLPGFIELLGSEVFGVAATPRLANLITDHAPFLFENQRLSNLYIVQCAATSGRIPEIQKHVCELIARNALGLDATAPASLTAAGDLAISDKIGTMCNADGYLALRNILLDTLPHTRIEQVPGFIKDVGPKALSVIFEKLPSDEVKRNRKELTNTFRFARYCLMANDFDL